MRQAWCVGTTTVTDTTTSLSPRASTPRPTAANVSVSLVVAKHQGISVGLVTEKHKGINCFIALINAMCG